jgi:hypothetical protein
MHLSGSVKSNEKLRSVVCFSQALSACPFLHLVAHVLLLLIICLKVHFQFYGMPEVLSLSVHGIGYLKINVSVALQQWCVKSKIVNFWYGQPYLNFESGGPNLKDLSMQRIFKVI